MAADLLEDEVPSPAGKEVLKKLTDALGRMQAVVEDLILFARTRAEDLPLNKAQTDLQALLARVIESHKPLWETRRLSVKLSAEGEPRPMLADGGLLEAAFTRLLLNAIHFNKMDGRISVDGLRPAESRSRSRTRASGSRWTSGKDLRRALPGGRAHDPR